MRIHKMLLTDMNQKPIAVQIPYKEWLRIETVIGKDKKVVLKPKFAPLCGTIKLTEDPLHYQKRIREEWK